MCMFACVHVCEECECTCVCMLGRYIVVSWFFLCLQVFSHVFFWEIQVRFPGKDLSSLYPLSAPDSKATFCSSLIGSAFVYGDINVHSKL